MDGYKTTPPEYRRFSSELRSKNPYSGVWMTTRIQGERQAAAEWKELLTTVHLFNPMAEIETWLEAKGESIGVPAPTQAALYAIVKRVERGELERGMDNIASLLATVDQE